MPISQVYATISIIGPVNVGKSSIMTTLTNLQGNEAPKISPVPDTPVNVEYYMDQLSVTPFTDYMRIQDTPGFNHSVTIQKLFEKDRITPSMESIFACCSQLHEKDKKGFKHELGAWGVVKSSDIILYVIDATHDPDTDHLSMASLDLLRNCGRPIIAIFNFFSPAKRVQTYDNEWTNVLKQKQIFWVCTYDAMNRDFMKEIEILEKVAGMGPPVLNLRQVQRIQVSIEKRKDKENIRIRAYREILAELLLDVAACRCQKSGVAKNAVESTKILLMKDLYHKVYLAAVHAEKRMYDVWDFPTTIRGYLSETEYGVKIFGQSADATASGQVMPWHQKVLGGGMIGVGVIVDCFGGMGIGTGTALALAGILFGKSLVSTSYNYVRGTYTISTQSNLVITKRLIDRMIATLDALRSRGRATNDKRLLEVRNMDKSMTDDFKKDFAKALGTAKLERMCLIDNCAKSDPDQKTKLSPALEKQRTEICKNISAALEKHYSEFQPIK